MSVTSITVQTQQFELPHAAINKRNVAVRADAGTIENSFLQ